MADEEFVVGDQITLTKASGGWKIEMLLANGKGVIGPAVAPIYVSPEDALAALRDQAQRTTRL